MYNISDWLGRVASIYHETVRRECLRMLLISSRHIVTRVRIAWAMSAKVCINNTGFLFKFSCFCGLERDGCMH